MEFLKFIYRNTLCSVIFGIAMMVLIAGYVAIGSGMPAVRETLEMNELQFFSAWPLKVLMVLLVASLATVTWKRIPFTPPRYGVWCVHAGIITLIAGMALYYNRKVEGLTRIWADPREGPNTVDSYYDSAERAIYVKLDGELVGSQPLPALPRFAEYENLDRTELKGITLGEKYPIRIDITGYWPYANIATDWVQDSSAETTGVRISLPQAHAGQSFEAWLVSRETMLGDVELEHRHMPASAAAILKDAAGKVHHLKIHLKDFSQSLDAQPGQTYPLGASGYTITVEDYKPRWSMFGTNEMVRALTLHVKTPSQEFRRMVLEGKDVQTDFLLNAEGAGPMGKRQKEPLDKDLVIAYSFDDPYHLTPRQGSVKHTLITSEGSGELADVVMSVSEPQRCETASGRVDVKLGESMVLNAERKDHLRRADSVQVVPLVKRVRDVDEAGLLQIVPKISIGSWSRETLVPFVDEAADTRHWEGETIPLPGTNSTIQLQLGKTRLKLPAKLTLKEFKLIPYAGGDESRRSMMRDFRSTLVVEDKRTGEQSTAMAHMNHPIYFDGGRWLFFQAAYDPDGARFTVIGVGNRPGVFIMITGAAMMFIGVVYAFYIKPIVVRRMKAEALQAAQLRRGKPELELEAVS